MIRLGIRQGTTIGLLKNKAIAVHLLNLRRISKHISATNAVRMLGC